jgi:hypothetical protein
MVRRLDAKTKNRITRKGADTVPRAGLPLGSGVCRFDEQQAEQAQQSRESLMLARLPKR